MSGFLQRLDRATRVLAVLVVLTVLATTIHALWPDPPRRTLTVHFPRTVGLYEGSDVRVLGIAIGTVEQVTPEGDSVRVQLSYDAEHDLPADAKAVIISPSLVSDRYVQLTPVYRSGPTLPDNAVLTMDRTAVPVELDRVYGSLDQLAVALGPEGANQHGALSRLLATGADNLDGQGARLHRTVGDLADALEALSSGRKDGFATVRQLEQFTEALAENDDEVRRFNADLADVAAQLEGEREDLRLALQQLALALTDIAEFVREHRAELRGNIDGLTDLSETLVHQQEALKEILHNAPVALANLDLAYNETTGTIDTRNNFAQMDDPGLYLCALLDQLGQPDEACKGLERVLDRLPKLPNAPGGPASRTPSVPTRDLTLGGILPKEDQR